MRSRDVSQLWRSRLPFVWRVLKYRETSSSGMLRPGSTFVRRNRTIALEIRAFRRSFVCSSRVDLLRMSVLSCSFRGAPLS